MKRSETTIMSWLGASGFVFGKSEFRLFFLGLCFSVSDAALSYLQRELCSEQPCCRRSALLHRARGSISSGMISTHCGKAVPFSNHKISSCLHYGIGVP